MHIKREIVMDAFLWMVLFFGTYGLCVVPVPEFCVESTWCAVVARTTVFLGFGGSLTMCVAVVIVVLDHCYGR